MADEKIIEVAGALIWREDRFLICKRPPGKARGGLWEFVGGKLEAMETGKEALARECKEELDITLKVGEAFYDVIHKYPDITVHLSIYLGEIEKGEPKLLEHSELRWIKVSEIDNFTFCPADEPILKKIKEIYQ